MLAVGFFVDYQVTINYDVSCRFFCRLSGWEGSSLFLVYWEFFVMNGRWIFQMFVQYLLICLGVIFFFSSLIWWIVLTDIRMLNQPYISEIIPLSHGYNFFIHCWIWLANTLLRIFTSILIDTEQTFEKFNAHSWQKTLSKLGIERILLNLIIYKKTYS